MSEGSHRSAPAGPGSAGIAVVVPHAAVLLPEGIAPTVVEAVWRILADPAVQAESLVAALPLRGADEVRSFALLVHEGAAGAGTRLQVVLRGDAVIDVDIEGETDARRVDARRAAPFYLATLDRVTAYRVALHDGPGTSRLPGGLPLVAGVAPSDGVAWDREEPAADVLPAAPPADPAGASRRAGTHALPDAVTDAEPVGRASGPGRGARRAAAPSEGSTTSAAADADADAAARARAASIPTAAIPTAAGAEPPQEDTAIRTVHAFRVILPGTAEEAGAAPDAERIPLDVPAVVGRRPRPPRVVRGAAPRLVPVPSPLGEISGTHVGLRQESGAVVVTDLDSTNGTAVLAPGAGRLALRPGESLVVVPGTRIDIGDGVVLEILSAR